MKPFTVEPEASATANSSCPYPSLTLPAQQFVTPFKTPRCFSFSSVLSVFNSQKVHQTGTSGCAPGLDMYESFG